MKKYLWFKIGLLLSIIPMAYATNSEAQASSQALKNTLFSKVHPFLKFSAGMISAKIGQSQSFSPDNTCYYNYSPTQNTTQRLLLGGALGAELALPYPFSAIDLGMSYYNAKFPSQGFLTQGADVISFDSYSYSYAVRTQQVLVEGQLFLMLRQFILPYFYAGIG